MAKTSGGVRNSKWKGDIYTVDGVRKEYHELNEERKAVVRSMSKDVVKEMWSNLSSKSVALEAGGNMINVKFTKSGIDHVVRDAMIVLSGKYMSRSSMAHIDRILAKSEYVPTSHRIYKGRKDGKELFFRYKDKDGRAFISKSPMTEKKAMLDAIIFIPSSTDNKKPAKPARTICRSFAGIKTRAVVRACYQGEQCRTTSSDGGHPYSDPCILRCKDNNKNRNSKEK